MCGCECGHTISPCGVQSSPDTCISLSFWMKFTLAFSIFLEKSANMETANILNKENKTFIAFDLKILWCKKSHRVRFYVYIRAYIFNLQKLPGVQGGLFSTSALCLLHNINALSNTSFCSLESQKEWFTNTGVGCWELFPTLTRCERLLVLCC